MLDVQKVPPDQWPERTRLIKEAARKKGWADRFEPLDLAVTLRSRMAVQLAGSAQPKPFEDAHNAHGVEQGTCVHLGNCDIGCDVKARNTLDLNYLPIAEEHGADIRPLHLVRQIEPSERVGYRVSFDRIATSSSDPGQRHRAGSSFSPRGSMGSTELLLRSRDGPRPCRSSARSSAAIGAAMATS